MNFSRKDDPASETMSHTDQLLFDGHDVELCEVSEPVLASRLISMGIFPGTRMRMVRQTLGGSTYMIKAGKHFFAMRKNEVNALVVKAVEEA